QNVELILITGEYEGHKVFGMVSPIGSRGSSKNHQFLFANKRLFSDKAIHSAVLKAMDGFWNPGESGNYCLMLDIPPAYLDVNVHPRKTEVKFFKPSIVFSLVQSSIERAKPKRSFAFESPGQGDLDTLMSQNYSMESDTQDTSMGLIKLTDSYFILNHGGRPYLIFVAALFEKYMNLKMRKVIESEITPLLIAEPYSISKGPLDQRIEEMRSFGIILERIDDENILAKSVPNYLSELPVRNILGNILDSLKKAPNEDLRAIFLSVDNIKTTKFSLQQIHLMLKPFLSNWGSKSFAKPINDEVLHRIYQ
ncbi:MAG: hypothetical protein E2O68_05900, partial [Deltaproteobacteria bacterium]